MNNFIYIKAWRGELSFGLSFWVVQIITSLVLLFIAAFIFDSVDAMTLIMAPYSIYAFICVMRCAKRYKNTSSSSMSSVFVVIAYIWSLLFAISMVTAFIEFLLS